MEKGIFIIFLDILNDSNWATCNCEVFHRYSAFIFTSVNIYVYATLSL